MFLILTKQERKSHPKVGDWFLYTSSAGGAALLPFSAPAVYKKSCALRTLIFIHRRRWKRQKGQHLPALEVYKNQSPKKSTNKDIDHLPTSQSIPRTIPQSACVWWPLLQDFHFLLQDPRTLELIFKAPGSLTHHRFRHTFSKGSWRCFEGVLKGPRLTPSKTLFKPF